MMNVYPAIDLLSIFNIVSTDYHSPVRFSDGTGFSIRRDYPVDIRFKPARLTDGSADDVVMIQVARDKDEASSGHHRIRLRVRASKMSEYLYRHFDYDENCPLSPSAESVAASKASTQPLMIEENEKFSFDPATQNLYVNDKVNISGLELLDNIFRLHCDTVHPVRGLSARSQVAWYEGVQNSLYKTEAVLVWILKNVFGRARKVRRLSQLSQTHIILTTTSE